MKKVIVLTIVILSLVVNFAQAQDRPTAPRPQADQAIGEAIKTYGRYTEEPMWTKTDSLGRLNDRRLSGLSLGVYAGATKDGFDGSIEVGYQIRSIKAPKLRSIILLGSVGAKQIEVDGKTQIGYGGGLHVMFDPLVFLAPKSKFVLNFGVGCNYTHVTFKGKYDVETEKEVVSFNRDYAGNPIAPSFKLRAGYEFSKQFSILADVSYSSFEVSRKPDLPIKKDYLSAGVSLVWKFERKVKK